MSAKKKEEGLRYNGKPLLRRGNLIYYGDTSAKYIIVMEIHETTKVMDLDVSTNVEIRLQTNTVPGTERIIKKAERDGLYAALDLGEFWLAEALSEN